VNRFVLVLRIGLAIGFAIDLYVGVIALFAPELITPLLDIPLHDPMFARLAAGEYVVAAFVYAVAFRDPRKFRILLWLCALDQCFAVVVPAIEVVYGAIPSTWKTVAPIPFQALLAMLFAFGAMRGVAAADGKPA
jgi:hypothetical protein